MKSLNHLRETLDFALMEPEATNDLKEMIAECSPPELERLTKIAGNLINVIRTIEALRQIKRNGLQID